MDIDEINHPLSVYGPFLPSSHMVQPLLEEAQGDNINLFSHMPRQVPVIQSQNTSSNKSNNNHIPTTPLFPSRSPQPSQSHFSFTSFLLNAIKREEREEEEQIYHDALPTPLSPIQELGKNTEGTTTQRETFHQVQRALVKISGQQVAPTLRYNIPIGAPLNHVGAVIHQFNRQGAH